VWYGLGLHSNSNFTEIFRVKEGVGNVSLRLGHVAHLTVTLYTACYSFIRKAS